MISTTISNPKLTTIMETKEPYFHLFQSKIERNLDRNLTMLPFHMQKYNRIIDVQNL